MKIRGKLFGIVFFIVFSFIIIISLILGSVKIISDFKNVELQSLNILLKWKELQASKKDILTSFNATLDDLQKNNLDAINNFAKDFTQEINIKGDDEIFSLGNNVNKILSSLKVFFNQVKNTFNKAKELTENISVGNVESVSSINEITLNIESIAGKINTTIEENSSSLEYFKKIKNEINQFDQAMLEISNNMNNLSKKTNEMLKSTDELSDITITINNSNTDVNSNIQNIKTSMEGIKNYSSSIVNAIKEIDAGTKDILTTLVNISNLSNNNNDQIKLLDVEISSFKT